MPINIEIGLNAIASYRRMNYEIWYALAEFVDNSTQSYANHKAALEEVYNREGEGLEVRITYERTGVEPMFRIVDNAIGNGLRGVAARAADRQCSRQSKRALPLRHGHEDRLVLDRKSLGNYHQETRRRLMSTPSKLM